MEDRQKTVDPFESGMLELDVRRLLCPMPVIRLQNYSASLTQGGIVRVRCTDPGTREDIPAWCRLFGHAVRAIEEAPDGEISFVIEISPKKGDGL